MVSRVEENRPTIFRCFRGSKVITDRKQQVYIDQNPCGGLYFCIELHHSTSHMSYSAHITQEDEPFSYADSRKKALAFFEAGIKDTIFFGSGGKAILDRIFESQNGKGPLHRLMTLYHNQNNNAKDLLDEMIGHFGLIKIT